MKLDQFIQQLANQGISLRVDNGTLSTHTTNGAPSAEIQEFLTEFADEIVAWLEENQDGEQETATISPDPTQRYAPFPLTDIQQAYWIGRSGTLSLGEVSTHLYLELACHELDVFRLNQAWQRLIEHHDMLRAVVTSDGQQQVLPEVPAYQITRYDLRGQSQAAVTRHLDNLRNELSHQVLPAEKWPLFDIRVTELADDASHLHLSLDALFWDFGSLLKLFTQWQQLYEAPDSPLTTPVISFRDYVLAEKGQEGSASYQAAEAYWQARIPQLPPASELPLVQDANQLATPRFQRRSFRLARNTWDALKTQAGRAGITPNGLLIAAFAEVLATWSKAPNFTLNLTLFNRRPLHPDVNELVGDFTTLNLLEIADGSGLPFSEHAQQIQQQLWQDLDHSQFSGVRVLRELARQQGAEGRALMPVVFTSGVGLGDHESRGFQPFGELVYGIGQTPQVWMDHIVVEEAGALVFYWDAVEDLFPAGLLDAMFNAYCTLLTQLANDESSWQATQLVAPPPEQLAQQQAINATDESLSADLLHTGFLKQVNVRADVTAVITPHSSLSYQALYQRVNQVSHWLHDQGAKPNTLVAVVMEKGWEQVVAVLAIHCAGAAYLPVDPELPTERQHYLLAQGEVTLALTQSAVDHTLSWPTGLRRLSVDQVTEEADLPPLVIQQQPTDLAYVIYTSGSTGLPKGVMIDHRGAVNTIRDVNRRFGVTAQDRVLALSALNFDLSVYDIFGLLAVGGTIVIPEPTRRTDPTHWQELITQHGVTLWDTVPALMQMLVEEVAKGQKDNVAASNHETDETLRPCDLATLRLVMLSGDWIPVTLPDRIKALWPNAAVHSLGGATEASIWSITYPIDNVDPNWTSIPYGRPMTNQTFHILDAQLQPRPTWVPGDLYIGGVGLALGYWRDAERTEVQFITHPETGARLYKTGDLGRYLPAPKDGLPTIEFLGREDFQVKIGGHRIELGEIETNLLQHPAVTDAVVQVISDDKTKRQLVAYVVANEGISTTPRPQTTGLTHEDYVSYNIQLGDLNERIDFKLDQIRTRELAGKTIQLTKPPLTDDLYATYLARQSHRQYLDEPVPLARLSDLLSCLLQINVADAPFPKYRYPSADSLYPVQTYLYVKPDRVEGLAGGFYYYHSRQHQLIQVSDDTSIIQSLYRGEYLVPVFRRSAFSLFFIADMEKIRPMCGDLSEGFCAIEAGCMLQLLMTEAPAHHFGLCPISVVAERTLRQALQLGENYQLFHSVVGGAIDPAQQMQWFQNTIPATTNRADNEPTLIDELRQYLHSKLPHYMVPTHFLQLEALPLTANGKVDRKALPRPEVTTPSEEMVAAVSDLEQTLSELLQRILEAGEISVTSNFFDLGAHSVHIVQLAKQLSQRFDKKFSIVDFFQYPTIRNLAHFIEGRLGEQSAPVPHVTQQPGQKRGAARRAARQRQR